MHQFALQILHRSEDAARDNIALDAREPVLHLIEPRRVGWREVQAHVAMCIEEVGDPLRLVAADVVADDMNFPPLGLAGDDVGQEGHELFAGVTRCRLAQHLAGGGVERRKQAERAIALVLEAMTLGAPRRQRQQPVLALECMRSSNDVYPVTL